MNAHTERTLLQGPAHPIELLLDRPASAPRALAFIAHPHPLFGGTMDNKVVQTLARAFVSLGYIAVRFNFRGVGASGGTHDHGKAETQDFVWLVKHLLATIDEGQHAQAPFAMAGFSFGAFVCSHAAAQLSAESHSVERMVLIGTATSRFDVAAVPEDTIVIHGEEDDTVPLSSVMDWARPQALPVVVMPGTGHFFHGQLPALRDLVVRQYASSLLNAV